MKTEPTFTHQAYAKQELAHLYSPYMPQQSAMRKLRQWIHQHPDLYQQLLDLGLRPKEHYYTRRQVDLIVKYLGEP